MSEVQESVTKKKVLAVLANAALKEAIPVSDKPETPFESNCKTVFKLKRTHTKVLDALRLAKDHGGLTDYELEEVFGRHVSTYRTARAELVKRGLVIKNGKRSIRGTPRIVWRMG
jgi:predicted transcriptional regulator